jgi:hypothetical protein
MRSVHTCEPSSAADIVYVAAAAAAAAASASGSFCCFKAHQGPCGSSRSCIFTWCTLISCVTGTSPLIKCVMCTNCLLRCCSAKAHSSAIGSIVLVASLSVITIELLLTDCSARSNDICSALLASKDMYLLDCAV